MPKKFLNCINEENKKNTQGNSFRKAKYISAKSGKSFNSRRIKKCQGWQQDIMPGFEEMPKATGKKRQRKQLCVDHAKACAKLKLICSKGKKIILPNNVFRHWAKAMATAIDKKIFLQYFLLQRVISSIGRAADS